MTRVLIADDASFMRQMIRDIIEPEGFEVVGEASDGVEVIEKFKELHPDLVMMDIKLMDDERHKECTGVPNARILENAGVVCLITFAQAKRATISSLTSSARLMAGSVSVYFLPDSTKARLSCVTPRSSVIEVPLPAPTSRKPADFTSVST